MKKLLPDQALSLQTRAVTHISRAFPDRYSGLTTDDRAELITRHLGHVLSSIAKQDGRVTIALTAGIDSRSTIAVALASGVEVRAVTMEHPLIAKADRLIPPLVCKRVNVRHDYLLPDTFDRERNALYTAHTFGNTADADRFFFAHRMFDRLQDAAWLVLSWSWSMAKAAWRKWYDRLTWEELRWRPETMLLKNRTFSDLRRSTESLREYIAWRDAHPEPYDWRDLWIRDQRISGVHAAI